MKRPHRPWLCQADEEEREDESARQAAEATEAVEAARRPSTRGAAAPADFDALASEVALEEAEEQLAKQGERALAAESDEDENEGDLESMMGGRRNSVLGEQPPPAEQPPAEPKRKRGGKAKAPSELEQLMAAEGEDEGDVDLGAASARIFAASVLQGLPPPLPRGWCPVLSFSRCVCVMCVSLSLFMSLHLSFARSLARSVCLCLSASLSRRARARCSSRRVAGAGEGWQGEAQEAQARAQARAPPHAGSGGAGRHRAGAQRYCARAREE